MSKTLTNLCSEIAKNEKKKKSVSIGNVREVMRVFADLCAKDHAWLDVFAMYVVYRARRRGK
jgi:hypothetical protein